MTARTIAVGDIHGEYGRLMALMAKLPTLTSEDKLLFVGDFVDRGPGSADVIRYLRDDLPLETDARIVCLRGNHEDCWLDAVEQRDSRFTMIPANGCLATLRSYRNGKIARLDEYPGSSSEQRDLTNGMFFPTKVVDWLKALPHWHEDEHAIYVHAGLPTMEGKWFHPSKYGNQRDLLWCRDKQFYLGYRGKRVVFGHTPTYLLPSRLRDFRPGEKKDVYVDGDLIGIDTGCGRSGALSAVELPSLKVYSSG